MHGRIIIAVLLLVLFVAAVACSPRAFQSVNKQAPEPPYAWQWHGGMDRAEYLKVTENEGEWK